MNMTVDGTSVVFGIGVGIVGVALLNSQAVDHAAEKVSRVVQTVWRAASYDNVSEFVATCLGLALASTIVCPAIGFIYHRAIRLN